MGKTDDHFVYKSKTARAAIKQTKYLSPGEYLRKEVPVESARAQKEASCTRYKHDHEYGAINQKQSKQKQIKANLGLI